MPGTFIREALATLDADRQPVTSEVEAKLRRLGEDFAQVWHEPGCPAELKKKIVHSLIEEITVTLDKDVTTLRFVVHWKGGCHTELDLEKPRPATATKTSSDALEVIRTMAPRYGDGQIAAVLNKSGLRTGKGKRWTQTRVATARRKYSIPGQRAMIPDPDILTLSHAAKHCGVSQYTIQQLVKCGFLENNQVVPHAPWEIRREDLESEPIRSTLDRLKRTGRLTPEGGLLRSQIALPLEKKEDDNEGYYG